VSSIEYVRGTHFFGDASPLNFWDTFRVAELDGSLRRIKEDGFNCILLVVPWALFQPETNPIKYDQLFLDRLDKTFTAAQAHDLGVVLRLGYLWEAVEAVDQTNRRYAEYWLREDVRKAWRHYLARMHQFASVRENFQFAFLSWEDFYWPILMGTVAGPIERRINKARISGFRDYLRRRFTLPGLKALYGLSVTSWNEVAVPMPTDAIYEQFLKFYENEILDPICCTSAEAFPGVRMEFRVDPEWIQSTEGGKFYHWTMNFPVVATKVVYYHANIARPHTDRHTAEEAQTHLRDLLASYCRMVRLKEKKPFIDQFNFFDDTFAKWSRINEEDVAQFINRSYDVLRSYSSGYSIWGYRDWCKDIIFNGSFDLGERGWDLAGGAQILDATSNGTQCRELTLPLNACASQGKFVLKLEEDAPRVVALTGRCQGGRSVLRIELSGAVQQLVLDGEEEQTVTAEFAIKDIANLRLTCTSGNAVVSKVQVYDRYYSQGFRTRDGGPRPAVEAFRKLNAKLSEIG
jgi:hypothetical protein